MKKRMESHYLTPRTLSIFNQAFKTWIFFQILDFGPLLSWRLYWRKRFYCSFWVTIIFLDIVMCVPFHLQVIQSCSAVHLYKIHDIYKIKEKDG